MTLKVNGQPVTEIMIRDEMERLRPEHDQAFREMPAPQREQQLRDWAKENVIEHLLLAQEAQRRNYAVDEGVLASRFAEMVGEESLGEEEEKKLKEDLRLHLQLEQLMEEISQSIAPPDEDELKQYYNSHQEEFTLPEEVNAGHIVFYINQKQNKIQAYQKIVQVEKRLKAGESFEQLAQSVSECQDWQLGWFRRGQMVPAFEEAVFDLKPGQISGIILTEYGYHIARLYDRRPERRLPFEEVRAQIAERLNQERQQERLFELIDQLKEKAEIVEEDD
ncbi:MAG: peptidyl-prolyl cis-trans isomerase [Caldisericaceae bacterium]|nr:peptidyl-prolyl cis-trans isomerase [Caldisericaceae bacterium]